jgi:methylmalonyl-CoA mutase N-terminal domain/subunit
MDFFEEIAKFRAARRMWAQIMKDRFKAKNPRSWWLRFHTQTAGCSLTHQQPYNNIIRTATEALAAVLGGTQSLHTNSFDEEYALPTEFAATIALRTQEILAEETGVVNTIDPLAGSYYMEALTCQIEDEAWKYIKQIDDMGGMLAAIDRGFPQREIANAAYRFKQQVDAQEKVIVGVNKYLAEEEIPIEILKIDEKVEAEQVKRLKKIKRSRDNRAMARALNDLSASCRNDKNVMPCVIEAVRAYATEQEICDVYREVFGEYRDPGFF